ncbi:hypothetical protein CR513_26039, partial [Mucuna pruriens]
MVECFHDNMILRKEFKVGQKVLLFNSRLKLIAHIVEIIVRPISSKSMGTNSSHLKRVQQ